MAAVRRLTTLATVKQVSNVWESAPVGRLDQPRFLNAAALIETPLATTSIRTEILRTIEAELQRKRDPHDRNGPRTIDLDLSLFDEEIIEEDGRQIPDPDILQRAFVAVPLAQLDPDYRHPVTKQTLAEIASSFGDLGPKLTLRSEIDLRSAAGLVH